jgi:hypothetical protein
MMTGLVLNALAQGEVVKKYFDKFEGNEQFVKVSISSKMFGLFTDLESDSEEAQEFMEAVSKLEGMKLVYGDSIDNATDLYGQATKDVMKAGFEELMSVKDAEENVLFSIKESGNTIEELMMVAGGNRRFVIMSVYGEIDLKKIAKLGTAMNMKGLSELEKLNDN